MLDDAYDCLVIDADHSLLLDPDLVQQLRRRRRTVVGVHDPGDPHGRRELERLGIDLVVERAATSQELLRVIVASARHRDEFEALTAAAAGPSPHADAGGGLFDPQPRRSTCLTVVTGPTEGVGATEVAVEIAAQLRARRESAVLVDADLVAPTLSQRLHVAYDPNINTAIDAVRRLSGTLSGALIPIRALGFELLGGLEHPKNWADLLPDEITDVIGELRRLRTHVVVNVSSCLEDVGFDTPGRHSVTRAVVAAADVIVAVADPSPIGVRRLSKWMIDVGELTDPSRVHVAFNRSGGGPDYRSELDAETRRTLTVGGISHLPADPRVTRAYLALDPVQAGPFTNAVADLAENAIPRMTPHPPPHRKWAVRRAA